MTSYTTFLINESVKSFCKGKAIAGFNFIGDDEMEIVFEDGTKLWVFAGTYEGVGFISLESREKEEV